MRAPNRTAFGSAILAQALARAGVRHACISPGSRSAPLTLALAGVRDVRCWSHVDERSGAFFALGLAKATRTPVVLVCTSGTAAANFLPAVVEAWHAGVPLVVMTADRPPELRDVGAGQAIDQLRLYGSHVRWFVDVGTPEPTTAWARWLAALATRAVATALGPPPGPVHLNVPLREPLVPVEIAGDVPEDVGSPLAGRDGPWARVLAGAPVPDARAAAELARVLPRARRPVVVAGPLDDDDAALPATVAAMCRALGAPLLADTASNLRRPETADVLVEAHDALLRDTGFAAAHAADAVVRLGLPPTSKATATWLARHGEVPHVVVDASGGWPEPAGVATHLVRAAPGAACAAITAAARGGAPDAGWSAAWRRAGRAAATALAEAVDDEPAPFEADAVTALAATLPRDAALYVGNSLAVRALDWFWPTRGPAVRVLANRGANGIDGFVSSVLGAAAGEPSRCTVGLCGDLSLYHDLNGLLAVRRHGVRAVLVVVDNDGGGIFDHLPVAAQPADVYEPLFATPLGLDVAPIVTAYGARFVRVERRDALLPALHAAIAAEGTTVVSLRVSRAQSHAALGRVFARAAAAAGGVR